MLLYKQYMRYPIISSKFKIVLLLATRLILKVFCDGIHNCQRQYNKSDDIHNRI